MPDDVALPGSHLDDSIRIVENVFGADARRDVERNWRPSYCGQMVALAQAIEPLTATDPEEFTKGLRIIVRLVGLPALVAALTVELIARSTYRAISEGLTFGPLRTVINGLEAASAVICSGTEALGTCFAVESVLQYWREPELSAHRLAAIGRWLVDAASGRPEILAYTEIVEAYALEGPGTEAAEPFELFVGADPPRPGKATGVETLLGEVERHTLPSGPLYFGDAGPTSPGTPKWQP